MLLKLSVGHTSSFKLSNGISIFEIATFLPENDTFVKHYFLLTDMAVSLPKMVRFSIRNYLWKAQNISEHALITNNNTL